MAKIIDTHSHILPGIDDGAGSWKEALCMLKTAQAQGIRRVIATPHSIFLYERRRKMKIKIKEGFLLRKVAGDHVVVPVGEAGKVFHGMIRLNDTGAFLWEQCRKETTKEQVLQAMAEKYEVDESVAADDLDRFLQQLRNAEILEETNE